MRKRELTAQVAQLEECLAVADRNLEAMRLRAEDAETLRVWSQDQRTYWRDFAKRTPFIKDLMARDDLIRWLAIPWQDADPEFPVTLVVHDEEGLPIGTQVNVNEELQRTWLEVVRYKSVQTEQAGGGPTPAPLIEG